MSFPLVVLGAANWTGVALCSYHCRLMMVVEMMWLTLIKKTVNECRLLPFGPACTTTEVVSNKRGITAQKTTGASYLEYRLVRVTAVKLCLRFYVQSSVGPDCLRLHELEELFFSFQDSSVYFI